MSDTAAGSPVESQSQAAASRTRRRRLTWIGHLAAGLALFALLRSVSSVWFTFTYDGKVQTSWQSMPTQVDVHRVFYASDVASMFGGIGGLPTPLVLAVVMLVVTAVAAWLQLWVLSVVSTVLLLPMAWLQIDAMLTSLTSGPSGDLVQVASGPQAAMFALFAAAGCSLLVTVQTIAVRREQLAQARARAAAEGAPPPPTIRELAGNLVASRLNRFTTPHPSAASSTASAGVTPPTGR